MVPPIYLVNVLPEYQAFHSDDSFVAISSGFPERALLLYRAEIVLANSAERANPIIWDILECCTWSDAALWITYFWIINPTTNVAYIFLHNVSFLLFYINNLVLVAPLSEKYCCISGNILLFRCFAALLSDRQCKDTNTFSNFQIKLNKL